MNFKNLHLLFFIICILSSNIALSQDKTSGIKLFFEKVYLHTDRRYYSSGDQIWFKAYLVNAQTNYLLNTSNNLYVELINPIDKIVSCEVIRLDNGTGAGDFKLDDSLAGGTYRLRAYTNWMRNFGSNFIFEKQVQVKNIPGVNKQNRIDIQGEGSRSNTSPFTAKRHNRIQFFPEGGSMVEGLTSEVAFKAEDENGNGIEATGSIVSAKGDTVLNYKTSYLGMGRFTFTPQAGMQYKALVKFKNSAATVTEFPAIAPDGFIMRITDADPGDVAVNIFSNAATLAMHPSGEITIVAKHAGKIFYKQKLFLKDNRAALIISKKTLPAGIASVTLYDESLLPYCERLIYFPGEKAIMVNIITDKNTYASKEKVTVDISVTDAQQQPVKANLSMSVTDTKAVQPARENIVSYYMLQSELVGKIENASDYFDEQNPLRFQQIDLLLRTQGWRSFLWRRMMDTSVGIKYLPEPGITISGNVKQMFSGKPVTDSMNISVLLAKSRGNKWYFTKSYPDGHFYLDGLPIYGTQVIKINSINNKGKARGEIFMDSLFRNILPVSPRLYNDNDTAAFTAFSMEATRRYPIAKGNTWYHVLPAIVVSNKKKVTQLADGAYIDFGYREYNFNITPADYKYDRLQDFLVKKIPGCSYDDDAVTIMEGGRRIRPRFIVDKREDVYDRIDYYAIPMTQVISVTVKHLVGRPTYQRVDDLESGRINLGANFTDVYLVYLQLKPGAYNHDRSKIVTEVSGYYEARLFYSPNYDTLDKTLPDVRTTVFWEPFIRTDENGKAKLTFYNADPKTIIRVEVQGVTHTGVPVAAEKKYEIK